MSLEDEIRQQIIRDEQVDPTARQATEQGSANADVNQMVSLLAQQVAALKEAVFRLARELDERG